MKNPDGSGEFFYKGGVLTHTLIGNYSHPDRGDAGTEAYAVKTMKDDIARKLTFTDDDTQKSGDGNFTYNAEYDSPVMKNISYP